MRSSETFHVSLAKRVSRALMSRTARCTAMPFMSVPDEAAVAEVFGTLSVEVAVMWTRSSPMPNSSAATCATF